MVNCTARQRQEPVVEKGELDDAIGVDAVLDMGPLGTKRPRANIYLKYIGLVILGAWLRGQISNRRRMNMVLFPSRRHCSSSLQNRRIYTIYTLYFTSAG